MKYNHNNNNNNNRKDEKKKNITHKPYWLRKTNKYIFKFIKVSPDYLFQKNIHKSYYVVLDTSRVLELFQTLMGKSSITLTLLG